MVTVQHPHPRCVKPYIVIPIGLYCNAEFQELKYGDWFNMQDGYRIVAYEIIRTCRMRLDSPECSFILQSIYGDKYTPSTKIRKWKDEALINGYDIDETQCLLVEVKRVEIE